MKKSKFIRKIAAELYVFFATIPSPPYALTMFSIVTLTFKYVLLDHIPAPNSIIYKAGIATEALLISIIASFVFYIFAVHVEKHNKIKTKISFIKTWINRITQKNDLFLNNFSINHNIKNAKNLSDDDIKNNYSSIDLLKEDGWYADINKINIQIKSKNKNMSIKKSVFACLVQDTANTVEYCEKILKESDNLPSHLYALFIKLKESDFINMLNQINILVRSGGMKNVPLQGIYRTHIQYLEIIEEIETQLNKEIIFKYL